MFEFAEVSMTFLSSNWQLIIFCDDIRFISCLRQLIRSCWGGRGEGGVKNKLPIFSCEHESFSSGFVHPDLAHSPPFMRHRCEKLKSLFSEQHVVAILDGFLTLGLVSALLYMHHGSVS